MKRNDNKGLSLIEIIVAIAIGSIVLAAIMLIVVQSVRSYRTQSTKASLQNDANIALNQISDNVMEGTCLSICNLTASDGSTYTSYIKVKDSVYYVYSPDDKILYQSETAGVDKTASVLCENVESFLVKILDYSIVTDESSNLVQGMTNPLQLRVFMKVAKLEESREVNRTISMRNDLSEILLTVDSGSISLIGYDVDSLGAYITSDN